MSKEFHAVHPRHSMSTRRLGSLITCNATRPLLNSLGPQAVHSAEATPLLLIKGIDACIQALDLALQRLHALDDPHPVASTAGVVDVAAGVGNVLGT